MPQFDADRAAMLERARQAGVEAILAIGSGTGPGALDCAIKLAEPETQPASGASLRPALYATIGIHPHEAKLAAESDFAELESLARHPRVIAWGEIGLDYFYDHSPREVQREVFIRQMGMARAARLPIIIHCRPSQNGDDAWVECLALLREHWAPAGLGGILHCFTGTVEHARAGLDLGFHISFAGNITFAKAQNIRDAAALVPLERMLIETDAPFLAPVPYRGRRNEPAFVPAVAARIAELRGLSPQEIGARTASNFYSLFRLQARARAEPAPDSVH